MFSLTPPSPFGRGGRNLLHLGKGRVRVIIEYFDIYTFAMISLTPPLASARAGSLPSGEGV